MSQTAMNHPTNLNNFYDTYSPYAEIKFVVLHNPYIDTVSQHIVVDRSVEQHSNLVRAYMLLLRRFLDSHPTDKVSGEKLWTLVCMERIRERYYAEDVMVDGERVEGNARMQFARQNILRYLAEFLGWSEENCPKCYDHWKESGKDYAKVLGLENMAVLVDHMRRMASIWPPNVENALPEQQCSI